jgi:hypothetical protein
MALNFLKIFKGLNLKGQSTIPSNLAAGDLYYDSSLSKFIATNNAQKFELSDVQPFNAIKNAYALIDTTGWATYADAAAATPADGTGGSANVTLARNTSTPLRSPADFLFTKDAANRQGQGTSFAFSIDTADVSKRLSLSFDYKTSANYVAGDMAAFVYDVTNATLITPSVSAIPAVGSPGTNFQVFFNATTSTSYRLILHVASVSALAYTLNFTNAKVGLGDNVVQVPSQSDWTSYTPSYGSGLGTCTNSSLFYKRVGDTIFIEGTFTNGTQPGGSARLYFSLPSGLTVDNSKLYTSGQNQAVGIYGQAQMNSDGVFVANDAGMLVICNESYSNLYFSPTFQGAGQYSITQPLRRDTATIWVQAQVPVSQWAGSTVGLTNSRVEFAFNTSTNDADDTTSFGYGAAGTRANFTFSTERNKRVRFLTPIQPTDKITLEFSEDRVAWTTAPASFPSIDVAGPNAYLYNQGSSTTDVTAHFLRYASGTSNWSSGTVYWRVSKSSNPLSIGQDFTNKYQIKKLATSVYTDGVLSGLTFSNLTPGKTYRITLHGNLISRTGAPGNSPNLTIKDGSTVLTYLQTQDNTAAQTATPEATLIYVMVGTSLTVTLGGGNGSNAGVNGDGTTNATYMMVEELPNAIVNTTW